MTDAPQGTPLSRLTTLRLGGPPRRLVECASPAEVAAVVGECDRGDEPLLVLGGGSNVLVADAGFDGTVARMTGCGIEVEASGDEEVLVRVQAGQCWEDLVARAVEEEWAGLEALSGIPGLAGASPIQNVGAYGQEVADVVEVVRTYDRHGARFREFTAAECRFAYRDSLFKRTRRYVVTEVVFRLGVGQLSHPVRYGELAGRLGVRGGERAPLAAVREAVLELRRAKGMVLDAADHDTWSAGSFFTNPLLDARQAAGLPEGAPRWAQPDGRVKTSAAWLIEAAGFGRGYGSGPARLSGKHTLALTNRGGATAADVLALAREIRDGVTARFGIELVNEPVLVGLRL